MHDGYDEFRRWREEAHQRARALDAQVEANPAVYALKLRLLMLLGPLFLIGYIAGLSVLAWFVFFELGPSGTRVSLQLLWLALLLACLPLKRLIQDREWQAGVPILRDDLPKLWALVDEIASQTGKPAPDTILLMPGSGARADPTGEGGKKVLYLGFPELSLVSPETLRWTIGHELGHFEDPAALVQAAGRHIHAWRKVGSSIGLRWMPTKWFAAWFADRLSEWALPLARHTERRSDELADAVCALGMADQLRFYLIHMQDQRHQSSFYLSSAAEHNEPPEGLIHAKLGKMASPFTRSEAVAIAKGLLAEETLPESTHDSFGVRMRRLGFSWQAADDEIASIVDKALEAPNVTASDEYIGAKWNDIAKRVDTFLRDHLREQWRTLHEEMARKLKELRRIEALEAEGNSSLPLLRRKMEMVGALHGSRAYEAAARLVLDVDASDPMANFVVAREMRDRFDPAAIPYYCRALEGGLVWARHIAWDMVYIYGDILKRHEEAKEAYRVYEREDAHYLHVRNDFKWIFKSDTLQPLALDEFQRNAWIEVAKHAGAKAAYAIEWVCSDASSRRIPAMIVEPSDAVSHRRLVHGAGEVSEYEKQLEAEIDAHVYCVLEGERKLLRRLRELDACIWRQEGA